MSEAKRQQQSVQASQHLPELPFGLTWSREDVEAMKAAYQARFGEPLPRTETLFAVAAIGYRKALSELSAPNPIHQEERRHTLPYPPKPSTLKPMAMDKMDNN